MIGLYAIVNIKNNAAYVGSTNDIDRRIKEHKTKLNANKHYSHRLQRAWNKYGASCFEFRKIAEADTLKEAREIEEAFLECFIDKLYNLKTTATGFASGEFSHARKPDFHMKTVMQRLTPEERKEKYGKAKGKKRDPEPYRLSAKKRLENPEYTKKLSEACKGKRKLVTCPNCGLVGGGGNMYRYHFDKCKK